MSDRGVRVYEVKCRRAVSVMWCAGVSFLVIGVVHAAPPTVSIYAVKLVSPEANALPGFNMATVEVVRSGDTVAPLAVHYTMGGMAVAGTDFHLLSPWQRRTVTPGAITIPRGYASVHFMVAPVDNHKQDGVRSVEFRLSPGADYTVDTTNGLATVYLTDIVSPIKTISTGGVQRHYFYHRPAGLSRSAKVPLLVFLNGNTVSGDGYYAGFGVLADQKGFDLIDEVLDDLLALNLQLVVLGTGEKKYHEMFEQAHKKHPQKMSVALTFNNDLAHLIEAGSDIGHERAQKIERGIVTEFFHASYAQFYFV